MTLKSGRDHKPDSTEKCENAKRALVLMMRSLSSHLCDVAEEKDRVVGHVLVLLEVSKRVKEGGNPELLKKFLQTLGSETD